MSDPHARDWERWIGDMITFGEQAISFVAGLDKAGFIADERTLQATLRSIQVIGQAARHVPVHVREAHPEIHWRQIVATRNRLVHEYMGIDNAVIWDIVQNELPDLVAALRRILDDGQP